MISLYTGTPGSGKSYHATERIDINLKQGVNVIANYKIKTNKSHKADFVYLDNNQFSVKFLVEYAMEHHELDEGKPKEHQTLIVIDEAAVVFPKKDYDKKLFALWMVFLRLHRQLGYDVLLITQNYKDVNQDVLGLVEYNYKHRLLTSFGLKGWLLVAIFRKKFISVKYWFVIDEKCDSYMFNIKKRVTRLYDTFGMAKQLLSDVQLMIEEVEKSSGGGFNVAELNKRRKQKELDAQSESAARKAPDNEEKESSKTNESESADEKEVKQNANA